MTTISDSQPIRPPRLTRASSKESAGGLLMSVIRTLTASRDFVDRDREKANLEREYRDCDGKLSNLVVKNHAELSQVMSAFSKISQRLKQARERVVSTRDKLQTCMKLLHCKRDELKKLWLESVENKVILELFDQVESIMIVPQEVTNFINKKHYLHATRLIRTSLSQFDGNLKNIDALKDVKSDLINKKEVLYDLIVDELHKHIYVRSTSDVIKRFKRQRSGRGSNDISARKMSVADILSPALMQTEKNSSINLQQLVNPNEEIDEDVNLSDPEEDSNKFIAILLECLFLLDKIPEAIETIRERCDKELINIIKRTGRELASENPQSTAWKRDGKISVPIVLQSSLVLGNSEQGQSPAALSFQDFLEIIFIQFKTIAQIHENVILVHLRRIESQQNFAPEDFQIYSMPEIWSKIQTVLQLVADLYLDIGNSNEKTIVSSGMQESSSLTSSNPAASDLSSYFAKRRAINVAIGGMKKKTSLFRFDSSSHAISLNAYLQEQKEAMKEKTDLQGNQIDSIDFSLNSNDQFMVCQPSTENIVLMFNPLMKFIGEIEEELQLEEGNHCPLYEHIHYCVKLFFNQVNNELERMLELSNKSLDIWKVTSDHELLLSLGLSRPLLHSTLIIDRGINDLKNLIFALPSYADYFLTLICNLLSNYKETCLAAYRGIVQPEPEDKRIISATWARDEDINRFLKSLPNWQTLQSIQSEKHSKTSLKSISIESRMTLDESPEEVRLRNMRESEILTSNLAQDTLIPIHEILSDVAQLRILAQLQESMEWLGRRVDELVNELPHSDSSFLAPSASKPPVELSPLSDVSIATLNQLSSEFEELAETCLLVLHLETRVHCFYFLIPVATQSSFSMGIDNQEADPEVIRLNKDLAAIDEAMGIALQPWKLRYIFEGLGHLISAILINSANTIQRMNSNGVKKMCRNIFLIQQTLTSITKTREVALDYAKQYFELFYHTPEEILAMIVELGPQFQLNEYISAIHLIHRSLGGRETHMLESVIKRLEEILSEVAVSL